MNFENIRTEFIQSCLYCFGRFIIRHNSLLKVKQMLQILAEIALSCYIHFRVLARIHLTEYYIQINFLLIENSVKHLLFFKVQRRIFLCLLIYLYQKCIKSHTLHSCTLQQFSMGAGLPPQKQAIVVQMSRCQASYSL